MSIIRDVRERVLTKPRKLQPQAPGNQVLRISLVILSLAISEPSSVAMVAWIEIHALESRVWWASFVENMVVLRAEYAHRLGPERDPQPCSVAVRETVLEWLAGINLGRAIHIIDN
jgi:hypothetical protein